MCMPKPDQPYASLILFPTLPLLKSFTASCIQMQEGKDQIGICMMQSWTESSVHAVKHSIIVLQWVHLVVILASECPHRYMFFFGIVLGCKWRPGNNTTDTPCCLATNCFRLARNLTSSFRYNEDMPVFRQYTDHRIFQIPLIVYSRSLSAFSPSLVLELQLNMLYWVSVSIFKWAKINII